MSTWPRVLSAAHSSRIAQRTFLSLTLSQLLPTGTRTRRRAVPARRYDRRLRPRQAPRQAGRATAKVARLSTRRTAWVRRRLARVAAWRIHSAIALPTSSRAFEPGPRASSIATRAQRPQASGSPRPRAATGQPCRTRRNWRACWIVGSPRRLPTRPCRRQQLARTESPRLRSGYPWPPTARSSRRATCGSGRPRCARPGSGAGSSCERTACTTPRSKTGSSRPSSCASACWPPYAKRTRPKPVTSNFASRCSRRPTGGRTSCRRRASRPCVTGSTQSAPAPRR
mmetsp:Transcript_24397/g.77896  ORF Transcript_24397/g.77896 Transcript_24397/m.77896 type:complete len:284 (+) Transcript_24397:314-1165(+)